jgi:hypothetical protein
MNPLVESSECPWFDPEKPESLLFAVSRTLYRRTPVLAPMKHSPAFAYHTLLVDAPRVSERLNSKKQEREPLSILQSSEIEQARVRPAASFRRDSHAGHANILREYASEFLSILNRRNQREKTSRGNQSMTQKNQL